MGLSSVFGPPLADWALRTFALEGTALVAGITIFVVSIPIALLYPSFMPERYGLYPDNVTPEERREQAERTVVRRGRRSVMRPPLQDLTVGQALRSFSFWMLVIAGGGESVGTAPLTTFQNARMGAVGYSSTAAALFYSFSNSMSFVGRFAATFFGDWVSARIPVRYPMAIIWVFMGIGLAIFGFATNDLGFYAWAVLYGVFRGASLVYYPNLMGAYFGRQAFGTIYGLRVGITSITGMAAPTLLGWAADEYGWTTAFYVAGAFSILGGLLTTLAVPPKEQARERAVGSLPTRPNGSCEC